MARALFRQTGEQQITAALPLGQAEDALVAATTAAIRRLVAILQTPKPRAPEVSP